MISKTRSITLIIIILFYIVLLSGCWNYREINDLDIVAGLAVDKVAANGSYLITFEIVEFKGGGREAKLESKKIEAEGKTIFDAARNAISISGKRLYWSHAGVAIISQAVAEEGIIGILDFINRDAEPREEIHILISKEKTAKELLEQQSITTDIQSFEIEEMIESRESLSKAPAPQIHDVINMLSGEGISVTLPAIGTVVSQGKKNTELSGTALFSKDKFIGFLDPLDTRHFLFVKDEIKGGLLTFEESTQNSYDKFTLEIFENKTKATPIYSNGKLTMHIDIHTRVSIGVVDTSKNIMDENGRKLLEENVKKELQMRIKNVIEKVQIDYGVDSFGFGSIVKKEKPELWKSLGKDWSSRFKYLDASVTVELEIKQSGHLSKSIKMGD